MRKPVIATYNIHRGIGIDRRFRPDRISAVFDELDPDILALQEVEWRPGPRGKVELEGLERVSDFVAVAGPNMTNQRGYYGNILLSRHPVRAARRIDLTVQGYEPRGAIDADIEIGDGILRVIATHLGLRMRERRDQVGRLKQLIAMSPDRPTILLGDFNDWVPTSPSLRPLIEPWRHAEKPRSFPSWGPLFSLDRILLFAMTKQPVAFAHRSKVSRIASDHLPVVTELDIRALYRQLERTADATEGTDT